MSTQTLPPHSSSTKPKIQAGFTLIELSIVLVIIALLVGGVLVGRDLIKAAQIRSAVGQFEELDTAINTFRVKYNCLPGDCKEAGHYGLTPFDDSIGRGGNGDGLIDFVDPVSGRIYEHATMLIHLTESKLLRGTQGSNDGTWLPFNFKSTNSACANSPARLSTVYNRRQEALPTQEHYHSIIAQPHECGAVLLPANAYAVDSKIDDSLPRSGRVLATGKLESDRGFPAFLSEGGPAGSDSPYCFTDSTPPQYNVTYSGEASQSDYEANGPLCIVSVRAGF